jgi:hypothetical protein
MYLFVVLQLIMTCCQLNFCILWHSNSSRLGLYPSFCSYHMKAAVHIFIRVSNDTVPWTTYGISAAACCIKQYVVNVCDRLTLTVCCQTQCAVWPHNLHIRLSCLEPHSRFSVNSYFCFTLKFTQDFFLYFLGSILTNLETEKDILPRKLTLLKHSCAAFSHSEDKEWVGTVQNCISYSALNGSQFGWSVCAEFSLLEMFGTFYKHE